MAADVSDFYDLVSNAINKGTVYDSIIPTYVSRAVRFLEQNYSFEYMKVIDRDFWTLVAGEDTYDQPANLKKVNLWRVVKDDGTFFNLEKVDPKDLGSTNNPASDTIVVPSSFYLEGRLSMILNVAPTESYDNVQLHYEEFTDWTDIDTGDSHWLITHAESLLLDQTVILMGARLRDPKLIQLHVESKKENLRVMALAEDELDQGAEDPIMQYEG